jgi:TetR/AcrR family transcriptional regulator, transcriptional repressor for nem operon
MIEIDPEDAPAHGLIAQNFQGSIEAVRECPEAMKPGFPPKTDLNSLATYILVVMEGGVMLSRSIARSSRLTAPSRNRASTSGCC